MAKAKQKVRKKKKESRAARKEPADESIQSLTPATFVRKFLDEMNRVAEELGVGRVLSTLEGELAGSGWSPQVEMFQRKGELILRADLPGLGKDDVKIELADGAVTIEGERRDEREGKREGFHNSERRYGKFHRRVQLPEGADLESVEASFRDGVLEITMPLSERKARGARKLEIRDETQPKSKARAA